MDETHVVTVFLRHGTDVLLLRRSDDVGSYAGLWGAVAGHAAADPEAAARQEIHEETGLDPREDVAFRRRGDPFPVEDPDLGVRWVVHPFLYEVGEHGEGETEAPEIEPNWETATWAWVPPTEIRRRETVPDLWRSYDAVRPTVETVATDREHGSAWLSMRALEVLRDEAALAVTGNGDEVEAVDFRELARNLVAARPTMTVLRNRVDRVVARATGTGATDVDAAEVDAADADPTESGVGEPTVPTDHDAPLDPRAVESATEAVIVRSREADEQAAAVAAERVEGARVATLSRSGTVLGALQRGDPAAVLVAESRPGREGVGVAEELADADVDVTLTSDAALAAAVETWAPDVLLVGADAVLSDGHVVNKVGTRGAALAARHEDVTVLVVAAADKVDASGTTPASVDREEGAMGPLYDGEAPLTTVNPTFDVTPPALVDAVLTEDGPLAPEDVSRVAAGHRARSGWRDEG